MARYLFRYDIKGFIKAVKRKPFGAFHEALIKHIYKYMFRALYNYNSLPNWLDLFRTLITKKKFLLIVLDDARFDMFKLAYPKYLNGSLRAVRVPPPNTYGWLPRTLSDRNFDDIRIFYASLSIETHDISIARFIPRGRNVEVIPIKPRRLKYLGTVLPSEVNNVVRKVGLKGRDIIWYAQPHFPWICDVELSKMLIKEVLLHDFLPPDLVADKLKRLGISRERVVNAYFCNLVLALRGVNELLEYIKNQDVEYDSIVVTSDHGEMLGELSLYLHQEYELPQLIIVPWLEVKL